MPFPHLSPEAPTAPETAALDDGARRYRELLNALPVVVYEVHPEPPYAPLFVSWGVTTFGFTLDEWQKEPDTWFRALHPDDRERVVTETAAAHAERRSLEYEYRLVAPDGSVYWVHDRGEFAQSAEHGTVWRGVMIDITPRKLAEEAMRASEARVRGAIEASLDALFICETVRRDDGTVEDFVCVDVNQRAEALVSGERDTLVGTRLTAIFPAMFPIFRQVLVTGTPFESEIEIVHVPVDARWVRVQVVRVGDGIGVTARDVTNQKATEETLRALALVDELTGVHNRRGFLALAEREWQRAQREHRGAVLAYIDLNDFKGINDRFGHAEGDVALQTVADVLRAAFRGADVIGRLGGDEFAVLVVPTGPAMLSVEEIYDVERRIVERLRYHLASSNASARAGGREYEIRMSIGTAAVRSVVGTGNGDGLSLASLMLMADERLYQQKNQLRSAA